MELLDDETTAPTGVTFSTPTTQPAALSMGTVDADEGYPVWIRVTIAADNDGQLGNSAFIAADVVPL